MGVLWRRTRRNVKLSMKEKLEGEVWMDIDLEIDMHDQEMKIGGGAHRERKEQREMIIYV